MPNENIPRDYPFIGPNTDAFARPADALPQSHNVRNFMAASTVGALVVGGGAWAYAKLVEHLEWDMAELAITGTGLASGAMLGGLWWALRARGRVPR